MNLCCAWWCILNKKSLHYTYFHYNWLGFSLKNDGGMAKQLIGYDAMRADNYSISYDEIMIPAAHMV